MSKSTTQIAFLRAINVGRRRVKSDQLADIFEGLGFGDVATYLASGNVYFSSSESRETLERQIAEELESKLGFDVPTFVRSLAELEELVAGDPFEGFEGNTKRYAVFLEAEVEDGDVLTDLNPGVDRFRVRGRDVYWLRDVDAGESTITSALEKALGLTGTRRNMNTLERLIRKFG